MKRMIISLVALLAFAGINNAGIIVAYDMYGEPGDQVSTPGVSDYAEVTVNDMVRGADLVGNTGSNSLNTKGWDSSDAGDYAEISFTVDGGYVADLDELWIGTRSSNTGPGTIGVYTNQDGFTSPVYTITQAGTNYSNSVIDMTGFTGITGDFTVRFIEIGDTQADGDGATASTGTWRIVDHYDSGTYTDVQITGVVTPEPAALGLLAVGALALLRRRRAA